MAWAAAPADWKPELLAQAKDARGPSEPLRVALPPLDAEAVRRLSFELDDFDITGMVAVEGNQAVFTPPQPLAFGRHQLRLVEQAADGNILERGVWTFEVRKTAAFREAQLAAATTLSAARRIADDGLPPTAPGRNNLNGAAQLQGRLADAGWRATGQLDLLFNSNGALLPRGADHGHIDMADFLLTAEAGPVVARAGHHAAGPDNLIMNGFRRRGVSAGLRSADTGAAATVFSQRTQEVIGFNEGLGIGDAGNRVDGVVVSGRPVASHRDALVLSVTYLAGEGPVYAGLPGTGIAGDTTITGGRAADIVADANLLERRLRLRGEYAATRYDFDGNGRDIDLDGAIDSNQEPERDRAYAALLTYTPWHDKRVDDKPFVWNLGFENRRVGTFFRSPANPAGVSDRHLLRGFTGVNWSGLDAQLSLGRETDNVNDLSLLPRTATRLGMFSVNYTPNPNLQPQPDGSLPPFPWYGRPNFNAAYIDMNQDVEKAGAGLATGASSATRSLALTASFTYSTWSWFLNHTLGRYDNFISLQADTNSRLTQLNANLRLGERLTLMPMLQHSEVEERDPPAGFAAKDTITTTAGLSLGYVFSPRLYANLGVNTNRQKASDDSQDLRSRNYLGSISWTAVQAQGARAGVTFSLEGQYYDAEDRVLVTNNQNSYQVFLKTTVAWLPTF
jgi:hypothetical protein